MLLSDLAKSGLESDAWVDESDYQNKDKNITITKKSLLFFVKCIKANTMWFPTLLLLPSWTSFWIFYNAENNNNMPVKFSKTTAAENYQKLIINCSWFQVKICFKMVGSLDISLFTQHSISNKCSIFIVCIIKPLIIHKKLKNKMLYIEFVGQIGIRKLNVGHLWRHL